MKNLTVKSKMSKRSNSIEQIKVGNFQKDGQHIVFSNYQTSAQKITHIDQYYTENTHSFKPEIHSIPFHIYPQASSHHEISKDQIFQRLVSDKRKKEDQLMKQKLSNQYAEIQENCTFQPKINENTKNIVGKESKRTDPFERLYTEGVSKIKSLDVINLSNNENKQNFPFQPNVNREKKNTLNFECQNMAPLYERIQQIVQEKRSNLKRMQEEQDEKMKESKFTNEKTNEILENKKDFKKNVLDRLFSFMRDRKDRIEKMTEDKEAIIEKECTFQPEVASQHNVSVLKQENFVRRQEILAGEMRERMNEKIQEMKESFHPTINKVSALLMKDEREDQTHEEQIERMHCIPLLERQQKVQYMEKQIYKACTFHPQINSISKALEGKPLPHRCNCHSPQEIYQFQPKINQKSKSLAQGNRKSLLIKDKPQFNHKLKMEIQYKEMSECSFRPKIISKQSFKHQNKRSLKEVQGFNSFIKKVEFINNKKAEEEAYKQKIFNLQKNYKPRDSTKIEQFKLTEPEKKLIKLKAEAENEFKKVCPFKPMIGNMR